MGSNSRKALSIMLSGLLATTMFTALPAAASAAEEYGSAAGLASGQTTEVAAQSDAFAADFDLRDKGVVTPVKAQAPWGSCWSFGGIAAAESSILTTMGMTAEQYKEKYGIDFDLSEKHLAWFGNNHITALTNPKQVGEGVYTIKDDPNAPYDAGGLSINVTTLFSSGVGPVDEGSFPYQGAEGLTERQYLEKHRDKAKPIVKEYAEEALFRSSFDEAYAQMHSGNPDENAQGWIAYLHTNGYLDPETPLTEVTEEQLEDICYDVYMATNDPEKGNSNYSPLDDWTIPETGESGIPNRDISAGFTLVDGNILPSLFNKDAEGHWESINQAGMDAVKAELKKGRAVSAAFKSDQARPGEQITEKSYINTETWAHYTHKDVNPSHAICIVGWDDDYPVENFNAEYPPPGKGAWLVKNSWGSETDYVLKEDGSKIGLNDWGIVDENGKHTGYFWISYYDKTLNYCESMTFDTDLFETSATLDVWMYDYMPSLLGFEFDTTEQDSDVIKTANVFPNDSETDATLAAVSTKTAKPNATVKYSMYLLRENAQSPEDGQLLGTKTATYSYAGFHREKLDGTITVKKGETLAVVVEETASQDGQTLYEYAVNTAPTKMYAEAKGDQTYGVAVVNKGESFIFANGQWTDWSEFELAGEAEFAEQNGGASIRDMVAIDNFSIKAYMVAKKSEPSEKADNPMTVKADNPMTVKGKTVTAKAAKKTSFKKTQAFKVSNAKGKVTFEKAKGNAKITVSKAGKVTVKKGLKKGKTYKVKVKVTAAGNAKYESVTKAAKVKVKVK